MNLKDLPESILCCSFSKINDLRWKVQMRLVNKEFNYLLWHKSKQTWSATKAIRVKVLINEDRHRFLTISTPETPNSGLHMAFDNDHVQQIFPMFKLIHTITLDLQTLISETELSSLLSAIDHPIFQLKNIAIHRKHQSIDTVHRISKLAITLLNRYQNTIQCLTGEVCADEVYQQIELIKEMRQLRHVSVVIKVTLLHKPLSELLSIQHLSTIHISLVAQNKPFLINENKAQLLDILGSMKLFAGQVSMRLKMGLDSIHRVLTRMSEKTELDRLVELKIETSSGELEEMEPNEAVAHLNYIIESFPKLKSLHLFSLWNGSQYREHLQMYPKLVASVNNLKLKIMVHLQFSVQLDQDSPEIWLRQSLATNECDVTCSDTFSDVKDGVKMAILASTNRKLTVFTYENYTKIRNELEKDRLAEIYKF